jgi:RIO kinase 3
MSVFFCFTYSRLYCHQSAEKNAPSIGRSGYVRDTEGKLKTKHDTEMCSRNNARRVMAFPPDFNTGDGGGFDMQLSNRVFNSLKRHSLQVRPVHNIVLILFPML